MPSLLKAGVDDMVAVGDEAVGPCMRLLANAETPIVAGESAVAGLAALVAAASRPALKEALGLSEESRVLIVVCEGATDAQSYEKILNMNEEP